MTAVECNGTYLRVKASADKYITDIYLLVVNFSVKQVINDSAVNNSIVDDLQLFKQIVD